MHNKVMTEIIYVAIDELKNSTDNPRKISKQQFEKLCENITADRKFFESRPCLVNRINGELIVYAGNQRLMAAKKLKWTDVPCIIESDIPSQTIKRRVIIDNLSYGEFDWDMLANEYDITDLVSWGIDPEDLLGSLDEEEEEAKPKNTKGTQVECPECGHQFHARKSK